MSVPSAVVLLALAGAVEGWSLGAIAQSSKLCTRARGRVVAEAADDSDPSELSSEFTKFLENADQNKEVQSFNDELYAHLGKRPEYETSEFYKSLRKRVDVSDPLSSELEKVKAGYNGPTPDTTPGEAIEIVLRALRDVDSPETNAGLDLLSKYSSPASALSQTEVGQLRDYFGASKYGILLEWVNIDYTRKLELSLDRKRALQQLKLTTATGRSVPVTFQLSQYETTEGEVWLIDQLLVKGKDL